MDYDQIRRYMDNDLIEIAPLAYMRGRTLNDAMIILDEGQNATVPQMKMFLTRMGQNARIVVTGDITQVDLPVGDRKRAGRCRRSAGQVPGVATVLLDRTDIVRHPLVQAIVNAYEEDDSRRDRDLRPARPAGEPIRRTDPTTWFDRPGVRRRGASVDRRASAPESGREHREAGAVWHRRTPAWGALRR